MEFGDELVEVAVDVADHVERAGTGGRGVLGDVLHLDGVAGAAERAASDDGQVAVGRGVAVEAVVLGVGGLRGLGGRVRFVHAVHVVMRDGRCHGLRHGLCVRLRRVAGLLGHAQRAVLVVRRVLAVHGSLTGKPGGYGVRGGFGDRNPEVPQRIRPHRGSLTGPLSHRPLHHRRAAVHLRTLLTSGEEGP